MTPVNLPPDAVGAVVLGVMQDGGLPHAGCRCPRCAAAFLDPRRAEYAAAVAVVDSRQKPTAVWLVDATPDLKFQLELLAGLLGPHPTRPDRLRQPDGIFLTHSHMGHVGGLLQFGPEVMAVHDLPLYASAGLLRLLWQTRLWSPLLSGLTPAPLARERPLPLAPDLTITPRPVPHRDELGVGTFAFEVAGPARRLLYVPDIDDWSLWPAARTALAGVDVALVDGSFYSREELGGRAPVAHPLVSETLAFFDGWPGRLALTHINHTNPVLDTGSDAHAAVLAAGAEVAQTGQIFRLD